MDQKEAALKADVITGATLNAIKPAVHWANLVDQNPQAAELPSDPGATDNVSRWAAIMTIVSKEQQVSLIKQVERNWKKLGYSVTKVDLANTFPAIYATTPENFRLGFDVRGGGQFYLEVESPEAQLAKFPDPTVTDSGTSYGNRPPRPNIRDDYWSSATSDPRQAY
ncbi:hypothetical protein [Streptomyces beijiangensis]|uniref:Uncharacterized protein n=1 Tax=Streptomyces beijiangensis TaxID=163361 RepID=A0A939FCE2_9ACTN|nr:hypothetical protein [Streptomyces beijiangensis]MBO0515544.1 hypothetical protein [Streptomyces beijiangensis]